MLSPTIAIAFVAAGSPGHIDRLMLFGFLSMIGALSCYREQHRDTAMRPHGQTRASGGSARTLLCEQLS